MGHLKSERFSFGPPATGGPQEGRRFSRGCPCPLELTFLERVEAPCIFWSFPCDPAESSPPDLCTKFGWLLGCSLKRLVLASNYRCPAPLAQTWRRACSGAGRRVGSSWNAERPGLCTSAIAGD